MQSIGIKCSPTSLGTARNWYNDIHEGRVYPYDEKLGGKFNELEYLKENSGAINAFLYENSSVTANRFSEKHEENMRYLNDNITHLYNLYCMKFDVDFICESSFRKLVHHHGMFLHAQRDSDICSYCNQDVHPIPVFQ